MGDLYAKPCDDSDGLPGQARTALGRWGFHPASRSGVINLLIANGGPETAVT